MIIAIKNLGLTHMRVFFMVLTIFASSAPTFFPIVIPASAQTDNTMDESRPHNHLYVGRISGAQFSNQSQEGVKPDWVESGRWIARVHSSGEDLTIGFLATIDMIRPDGSSMHRHFVNNFRLTNVSSSDDNSTTIMGTATVTMSDGPVAGVPISFKVHGESLVEILIGPDRVSGHFGTNPMYGIFTFSKTTFLDTGESETKQTPRQEVLPVQTKGPAIPSKGYLVEEIKDNLYWVTDGSYNTIFLVGDNGVAAVDAPPSIGNNYLKAIAEVTDKPIRYVIYSHSHLDHIGAAAMFPRNATYIAQENVALELQKAHAIAGNGSIGSQLPPVPTVTFRDNYTLSLDGSEVTQILKLDYHGSNHEQGNIFIYAPNQKVLMLVDIVFPGWVPFRELAIAKDVAGFIDAHDIALSYDFDTFVGGHLTRLGTRQDVETQKEFVMDLMSAAGKANGAISFADVGKKLGPTNDTWKFYGSYLDAVNEKCTDEMLSKWIGRLGGAEAFMSSHCWAMAEAMRVDPVIMALSQTQKTT